MRPKHYPYSGKAEQKESTAATIDSKELADILTQLKFTTKEVEMNRDGLTINRK